MKTATTMVVVLLAAAAVAGCDGAKDSPRATLAGASEMRLKIGAAKRDARGGLVNGPPSLSRIGKRLIAVWADSRGIHSSAKAADGAWSKPVLISTRRNYYTLPTYCSGKALHVVWVGGGWVRYTRSADGLSWRKPVELKSCTAVACLTITGWDKHVYVNWCFSPKIPTYVGAKARPLDGPLAAVSEDGGNTWTYSRATPKSDENYHLDCILDRVGVSRNVLLGRWRGTPLVFRTSDGGKVWSKLPGTPAGWTQVDDSTTAVKLNQGRLHMCGTRPLLNKDGSFREAQVVHQFYDVGRKRISGWSALNSSDFFIDSISLAADKRKVYVLSCPYMSVSDDRGETWRTYDVTKFVGRLYNCAPAVEAEGSTIHLVHFSGDYQKDRDVLYSRFSIKDVQRQCPLKVRHKDPRREGAK